MTSQGVMESAWGTREYMRELRARGSAKQFAIPAKDRILARVKDSSDCWIFDGRPNSSGYGKISYQGRDWYAHRLSYTAFKGDIPEGSKIDHRCHVKMCVNPEHLRLANTSQNTQNHQGPKANSRTGVRGVYQAPSGKYVAQFAVNGRKHHVGTFADLRDAELAIINARIEAHTHNELDHQRKLELEERA